MNKFFAIVPAVCMVFGFVATADAGVCTRQKNGEKIEVTTILRSVVKNGVKAVAYNTTNKRYLMVYLPRSQKCVLIPRK